MADLESVLADVSYLMTIEKSRAPNAKPLKKVNLPDVSVQDVVHKWMLLKSEFSIRKIYHQRIGAHFLTKFIPETCTMFGFFKGILDYEKTSSLPARQKKAKALYDKYIYADLLAMESLLPKEVTDDVSATLKAGNHPHDLFSQCRHHLYTQLTLLYLRDFEKSEQYVRFCQWKHLELSIPSTITLQDFSIHRIIGRGGFGEVYGCRKDDSGRMFALKLLDKKRIKVKKGELLALNERNMLAMVNSPFVVNLYYAFQTSDKLCFLLDLMNGGDLHYHLTQRGVFSEKEVQFYTAELILALEHIHEKKIVYRDLKPSNILLDEDGHIRLSDLGLACEFGDRKPSSCVGTHGYMAPEVIKKGVQYTFTADWFSLGCVVYKLLRGHSPFRSQNKEEVDEMVLTKEVHIPSSLSAEMSGLLTGLLEKDVNKRLGCRGRGAEELKEMPFFADLNWDDVAEKKLTPPLIPPRGEVNAADAFDIGSFDSEDTKGVKLTDEDQKLYAKFNTVVSDRWQAEIMESIFHSVNQVKDQEEAKERKRFQKASVAFYTSDPASHRDCLLQGFGSKQVVAAMFTHWQKKFFMLYPNRIEVGESLLLMNKASVIPFEGAILVEQKQIKGVDTIRVQPIGSRKEYNFKFDTPLEHQMWFRYLRDTVHKADITQRQANPSLGVTEDGGFLAPRRAFPKNGSPRTAPDSSGHHAMLSHTRSVPML